MKKTSYSKKLYDRPSEVMTTPKPEITGVSRSGRVRKKSSKLLDYESGAEEERSRRKTGDAVAVNSAPKGNAVRRQFESCDIDCSTNDTLMETQSSSTQDSEPDTNNSFQPYQINEGFDDTNEESSGGDEEASDEEINSPEISPIFKSGTPNSRLSISKSASTLQKSIYMAEKFPKKKVSRRTTKAERKDKGKARFSAYMLWAKEVRPDLMKANPNIGFYTFKNFCQLSSKLSDLWATVPYTDKYMWKQKAKRMALMAKNDDNREEANLHKAQLKTSLRERYEEKKNAPPPRPVGRPRKYPLPEPIVPEKKPPSTEPLDVAAHLKLLGESLSIIGQRLKEHQGQIAVSGSLSVLLDTLLCSLGPLVCLTQQVDQMNGCSKETVSSILDNIAYIMPGL